jgi:hypothetical protein
MSSSRFVVGIKPVLSGVLEVQQVRQCGGGALASDDLEQARRGLTVIVASRTAAQGSATRSIR